MLEKLNKLYREFSFYSKLPEMNLFWIFLGLAAVILVAELFYLKTFLWLINLLVFLAIGSVICINSFKLAKRNFLIKLEQSELREIVVNLQDGVIFYDQNFKILVFNKAAEALFHIRKEQIIGREFSLAQAQNKELKLLSQVIFPSLAPVVINRSEPGVSPQVVDISFEEPYLELRVTTAKILDDQGKLLGFMKIIHNRTREVEISKSKSEFVTVAAHQLRTPLNGLKWTLEILANEQGMPKNIKDLILSGQKATDKLLRTVSDLLDVSKIEGGKFGYEFKEVEFVSFLNDVLTKKMDFAAERGVKIYFERPQEPSLNLRIDPQKITVVLDNFLDNAIKYNIKNGEIRVKLEKKDKEPFIQVSISDTGVGIPPQQMKNLFKKFFRGDNVVKFETEGTGLGIYIAKNVIQRHGGQIWAESEQDRGSTFYFTLPIDPKLIPPKEVFIEEE